ncbi:MAG TPA: type II toxin-antitoxin system VapC family toxin [Pantanalinema sp.]
MSPRFVLDTSAILALFHDEPGADRVEGIIRDAARQACHVAIAGVSLLEVYYRVYRLKGEEAALEHYLWLRQLPLEVRSDLSERWLLESGRMKARHPMSLADAQIAALAVLLDATLVHKDPEFEPLTDIRQEALPLKPKKG